MSSLVKDPNNIKLAMLGMVEGNGHPYSWSAIFNGYNSEYMKQCPYPCIPAYLTKEPSQTLRIPGAEVTHIWTDKPDDAAHVAKAANVPTVVEKAEEVIGHVDAVIIATDKGEEHVRRCQPFIEAGVPIFVDKPLTDNIEDLKTFRQWIKQGYHVMSGSSMRYCKELLPYRESIHNLGELRFVTSTMPKTWETYGIHALEAIMPIVGAGFISCRNSGSKERNIVHFKHRDGFDFVAVTCLDMYGGGGVMDLIGTADYAQIKLNDMFYSFKKLLEAFVVYLRTGIRPFAFAETDELIKMVIAGIMSREQGGREIYLEEIA